MIGVISRTWISVHRAQPRHEEAVGGQRAERRGEEHRQEAGLERRRGGLHPGGRREVVLVPAQRPLARRKLEVLRAGEGHRDHDQRRHDQEGEHEPASAYSHSRARWVICVSDAGASSQLIGAPPAEQLLEAQRARRHVEEEQRQHQQHDAQRARGAPVEEELDVVGDRVRHHDHLAAAQHRRASRRSRGR